MTKANLVEIIREKIGFGIKESTEAVEQVFDILKETLEGGEKVKISGFGIFVVRQNGLEKDGTRRQVSSWRFLGEG